MPEFTVKEVRLPELHLPEIKRDEIVRTLSGIRMPEVDLAGIEPRRRLRGINLKSLPTPPRGMAGVDAGKLVAAAITAARVARPAQPRARWSPFRKSRWAALGRSRDNLVAAVRPAPRRSRRRVVAVVVALLAVGGWMLFRNPAFRARLDRAVADARHRIDEMRSPAGVGMDLETGEPVSVAAADITPGDGTEIVAAEATTDITDPATDLD